MHRRPPRLAVTHEATQGHLGPEGCPRSSNATREFLRPLVTPRGHLQLQGHLDPPKLPTTPGRSEAEHKYKRTQNLGISLQIEILELRMIVLQSKIRNKFWNFRSLVDFTPEQNWIIFDQFCSRKSKISNCKDIPTF
jgi:hypothetical protein